MPGCKAYVALFLCSPPLAGEEDQIRGHHRMQTDIFEAPLVLLGKEGI
jgi:hypothetical protein